MNFTYRDSLAHASIKKSKSKYKGGFKNGKNTKEYNHDYYIKNKDKWAKRDKKSTDSSKDNKIDDFINNLKKATVNAIKSFDKLLSKGSQFINKAKEFCKQKVSSLISSKQIHDAVTSSSIKKNNGSDYKYKYRVTLKNGKYRYFYSDVEYYSFINNVGLKDPNTPIEDDAKMANPHYGKDGYDNNCPFAVLAYDLRRRGYDVEAIPDNDGAFMTDIKKFYDGAKWERPMSTNDDFDYMEEYPKLFKHFEDYGIGARGHLTVEWVQGYGHDMAWEVDESGKALIIDAQTGTVYRQEDFWRLAKHIYWPMVATMRTDNLKLSPMIVNGGKELGANHNRLFANSKRFFYEEFDFKHSNLEKITKIINMPSGGR